MMSLFGFLRPKKDSANVAKERLRILVAQERSTRGGPDYLPVLRRELLEVIRKYVSVDLDAVQVNLTKDDDQDVLDISVSLSGPEGDGD